MEPILPFIMAGDPSLSGLPALLAQLRALGAGTVEVGLPHSDPVADGPVLQAAAHRALGAGASPRRVLEALAGLPGPDVVLFTYFNPLLQLGEDLEGLLAPTPVKSLLVVDLPFGEEPAWEARLRAAGYPLVPLLTPTTPLERARLLLATRPDPGPGHPFAQRFAYVVARLGVTGAGQGTDLAPVAQRLEALKGLTDRPLAVGFGLDDPASLERVRALGAVPVVGSALVAALAGGADPAAFLAPRMPAGLNEP
ncbi:tryptophan synthase subunit alpha [Mesoterricola silvestris]|uniref:tryptophan synthase n=1 Tax=Mesoterricola silvestris TaxID=2927979 RepID=A0AA48GZM8_9BACT|nr:tryptophan synthase subunit alpha [Mesoterricola silvestris]BDU73318.1 tryptophan synthase alpha chain [Mesoterricola silvestris]